MCIPQISKFKSWKDSKAKEYRRFCNKKSKRKSWGMSTNKNSKEFKAAKKLPLITIKNKLLAPYPDFKIPKNLHIWSISWKSNSSFDSSGKSTLNSKEKHNSLILNFTKCSNKKHLQSRPKGLLKNNKEKKGLRKLKDRKEQTPWKICWNCKRKENSNWKNKCK